MLATLVFGGRLTFNRTIESLKDFFSTKSDLHILYGSFHGHRGSWKLSEGSEGKSLGLSGILEQWDLAKQNGRARHLLIVSDACESAPMAKEATGLARTDISVQASFASYW